MLILIFLALVFNLFKSSEQTILQPAYAGGVTPLSDRGLVYFVTTNQVGDAIYLWRERVMKGGRVEMGVERYFYKVSRAK
jgi:hypothetical protein